MSWRCRWYLAPVVLLDDWSEVIGLTRGAYYYKPDLGRKISDAEVKGKIDTIHVEFPTYGYRRIYKALLREDTRVNPKRLRRIMKDYGLFPIRPRAFIRTTDANHPWPCYPNLLAGIEAITGPNQVWVADITYIRILTGFVFLAAILDLYSRNLNKKPSQKDAVPVDGVDNFRQKPDLPGFRRETCERIAGQPAKNIDLNQEIKIREQFCPAFYLNGGFGTPPLTSQIICATVSPDAPSGPLNETSPQQGRAKTRQKRVFCLHAPYIRPIQGNKELEPPLTPPFL